MSTLPVKNQAYSVYKTTLFFINKTTGKWTAGYDEGY